MWWISRVGNIWTICCYLVVSPEPTCNFNVPLNLVPTLQKPRIGWGGSNKATVIHILPIMDSNEESLIITLGIPVSGLSSSPQVEIGTLAPPDYNYPMPEASLEEQEEGEEEELPLKPQLIPQGSGGSGVLMGPDTQKGLKQLKAGTNRKLLEI